MSMSFPLTPKASIIESNWKPFAAIRSEVITVGTTKQRTAMTKFPQLSKQVVPLADYLHVQEVVERQCQTSTFVNAVSPPCRNKPRFDPCFLKDAYEMCRKICAEYAKTFYLGTLLMTEERQRAIWAIYVWCRRTDELVDGPNADHMSSVVLDRWEERLHDIFNGRPYDMPDAALTDTVSVFPLDIKPFRDMIELMRMDTRKTGYKNFEELYLYCYYVAGTVGIMSVPIMGISPESIIPAQSVYLGIGNQLTNILRDVGEDALRGRVYLPPRKTGTVRIV